MNWKRKNIKTVPGIPLVDLACSDISYEELEQAEPFILPMMNTIKDETGSSRNKIITVARIPKLSRHAVISSKTLNKGEEINFQRRTSDEDEIEHNSDRDEEPLPKLTPYHQVEYLQPILHIPCSSSSVNVQAQGNSGAGEISWLLPSLDELLVDDPSPGQNPDPLSLPKRGWPTPFSKKQTDALQEVFKVRTFANPMDILNLEGETGLSRIQIHAWFNYQRAKLRRRKNSNDAKTQSTRNVGLGKSEPRSSPNQSHSEDPSCSTSSPTTGSNQNKRKSSSESESTPYRIPKLNFEQKRDQRMKMIESIKLGDFRKCLNDSEQRIHQLFILYANNSKYQGKKTLLTETMRLRETSSRFSPFTEIQTRMMTGWKKDYLNKVFQSLLNERMRTEFNCFKDNFIFDIWFPIIIYGKLISISTEAAINDFRFKSTGGGAASPDSYTIPDYLRHLEKHSQH